MRLPRDLSGHDLVRLLRRFAYHPTRQVGSHIRLESKLRGASHHVTIPDHDNVRVGTMHAILIDVAEYLKMDRSQLARELFEE